MLAAKRQWIYSGLGVPRGMALVRPTAPRAALRELHTVVLCGGSRVPALAVPLGALASGDGVRLTTLYHPGTTAADWAREPGFPAYLRSLHPAAVLYLLSPDDPRYDAALTAAAQSAGAEVRWMPPPGATRTGRETVPAPSSILKSGAGFSVGTYAAWAGAAWKSLAGHPARRQ